MPDGTVINDGELGYGRVVMAGTRLAFFDVPSRPEIVLDQVGRAFKPVGLPAQTRVWWLAGDTWTVGRVDSPTTRAADYYYVHFPNNRTESVPVSELRVRWNRPLNDPMALLVAGTVESRFLYDRRNDLAMLLARQRSAALGLTGLLSSAVELHEHQVGAARRVLTDPVPRYLLADEVGLGKTVEAGMIIRQLLTDTGGKALVLAPDHLVSQWTDELKAKFAVDYLPGTVEIRGHSDLSSINPGPLTALVVDEAHRLAEGLAPFAVGTPYDQLRLLTAQAECLLLLSATPVRSNEDAFLGLLHLLEPGTYPLDNIAAFRDRVAMRDGIATALSALGDETPVRYLRQPLEDLSRLLVDDEYLQGAVAEALAYLDVGDQDSARGHVANLRMHVSETYRLHRRMVRTRRDAAIAKHFPVRGREHLRNDCVRDPDPRRGEVLASVEAFRIGLEGVPEELAAAALQVVLGRCSGPIDALEDLAHALRGETPHDLSRQETVGIACVARQQVGLQLARELDVIVRDATEADRISAVVNWCRLRVARGKWAVACSFPATASKIADALEREFGRHRITALLETQSVEERAASIRLCRDSVEHTIIVLDRSAEEGTNLQFVEEVLHANLPTVTSQLEQRLGRFDRWSEVSKPVASHIFVDQDETLDKYLRAWERVQIGVFDVLDTSTSIVQYVIADAETRFFSSALKEGLEASAFSLEASKGDFREERRKIRAQDLLDSIEDRADDTALTERLVAVDRGERDFESSVYQYAHEMLRFAAWYEDGRIHFGVNKKHPPLLPERDIAAMGMRNFDRWYTSDRMTAGEGLGFLRSGDPLIDGFDRFLQHDDRGRAFLVEVPLATRDPERASFVAFRFDFRVQVTYPTDGLPSQDARAVHARAVQHCPDTIERVWLLPGRGECPPELRTLLDARDPEPINLGSRPERFRELTTGLDWDRLCRETFETAVQAVSNRQRVRRHLEAALLSASESADREISVLIARKESSSEVEQVRRVTRHARVAIESAVPVLESCGAAFVTWDVRQ